MRPEQWVKNLFVFLPLFFDRKLFDVDYLWPVAITFVAVCLLSSAVYCFNDLLAVEADRLHPTKRLRPIASGKISASVAYVVMAVCASAGIALLCIVWYGVILYCW